jgi:two-component system nitrogen regulation sensor histidine kinase GlnL
LRVKEERGAMGGGTDIILDCLNDGIVVVDGEHRIVTFNQAAEGITGLAKGGVLGRPFADVFRESAEFAAQMARTIETGQTTLHHDARLVRRGAAPCFVDLTCSPVIDESGAPIGAVAVFRDRTTIREMEEQSRHSDRLALLGTMAAGIAHEVKNPLGGIRGAAQILKKGIAEGGRDPRKLAECADLVIHQVDRIDGLIEELLELSSRKRLHPADVNVNKVLNDLVTLLRAEVGDDRIVFQLAFDPSLPPVRGDETRLAQVFLNLLRNAVEALRDRETGGTIRVLSKVDLDLHLGRPDQPSRTAIAVEIADDGPGVRSEDLEKVFTPFYTTRARGTGLGLALSHKLVEEHGGSLRLQSRFGEGTTVRVVLPAAEPR